MKFIILSHAGMYVEHQGTSVITDPWLIGSCYWRSWWNFPEPERALLESLKPNYIYISHLHWDHFHGVSLRKLIDRKTTILVPKVCTTRMVDDLNSLGYRNVVEIPHGGKVRLNDDLTLSSYQFGVGVDSAAVMEGGGVCLFDVNDCKLFGFPLQQVLRRHGRPDFVLRSHSSASALPYCVDGHEKEFSDFRTPQDYIEEFTAFALSVGAKYAIPFASNHCFVHKETIRYNPTAVTPRDVAAYCNQQAEEVGAETRCVVMAPGSSWSDQEGFQLVDFDYSRREEYVQGLLARRAGTLQKYYAEEENECADFESFRKYFEGFVRALPFVIRRRLRTPFLFRVTDKQGVHRWLIEPAQRAVREVESEPPEAIVFETHPRILNDCTQIRMFSVWTASKRLKIYLPSADDLSDVNLLFTLLDAYELDNLPLLKNLRRRNLGVFLRRWREGAEALRLVLRHKVLRRPFKIRDLYPVRSQPQTG
jgi:UDP-MurNAc hydroxylase